MSAQDRSPSAGSPRPPSRVSEFTTYMPAAEVRRRSCLDDSPGVARARDGAVERVISLLRSQPGLRRA